MHIPTAMQGAIRGDRLRQVLVALPAALCLGVAAIAGLASAIADPAAAQTTPEQPARATGDPYPLLPADTSSPRDALQSFLRHVDYVADAWKRGSIDARAVRNFANAAQTMDFSTLPGGEAFSIQTERILLLKELLDRIELPPAGEIPGDAEVAAHDVRRWAVPGTSITIARIDQGRRAGDYVFSADTVERLDFYYRLAKHLPYKPTATTPGIYDAVLASAIGGSLEEPLRNRLKRIDASSPRATLVGFLDSINEAYALAADAQAKLKAVPPRITEQEARESEATAHNLLMRAAHLLDLSALPEAYRSDLGIEAALQLKEVLDRTLLPFLESVPDKAMVDAARVRARSAHSSTARPEGIRWQYPNTPIEIVEVTAGERRGQFLFSADTVRRAPEFYARVRDLPYRSRLGDTRRGAYDWAPESSGLFERYIASPAYLIPQGHFLGRLVDGLPAPFRQVVAGQTVWKWTGLALCVLATVAAGIAIFRLTSRIGSELRSPWNNWTSLLAPVLVALTIRLALDVVESAINITGRVLEVVVVLGHAALALMAVWAVARLAKALSEMLVASPRIREGSHDASLVRIGGRILSFVAGCMIVVYSLRNLGADMIPLLAGLGVGGLAVALAAQRTFANFIGSLILYANKPVGVGDFCRYGDQVGTVEHIGLLATRIRSLERTIVTVPNAEFSEMKIDNYAVRDQRLLKTVLQLRYETTSEQLRYVLARLRELLLGHPKVTPAPARVRFVGYGAYSKDVEVFAYLDCADQDTFLAIQEDILLRIEDIVLESGSGFAFPSQTAYLSRDKAPDTGRRSAAEASVARWRAASRLPFPEFGDDQRGRLENVLDYPPRGSPDFVPQKYDAARRAAEGLPTYAPEDLTDLPALAAKLRSRHRLSEYLQSRFSDETRTLLAEYDGGRDQDLKEALVNDLNEVVLGPPIYDAKVFREVRLRDETEALLAREPQGELLARLNRLLLDDAFSRELSSRAES